MKYRVTVLREIAHATMIEVDAADIDIARKEAERAAENAVFDYKYPTLYTAIACEEVKADAGR